MRPARPATTVVLVRGSTELLSWSMPEGQGSELVAVELLARWQLEARRRGCRIELRVADRRLEELLDLAGLVLGPENPVGIAIGTDDCPPPLPLEM